jgi:peptidoglycan/LPS O-acetylase OafA/YrhL
MVNSHLETRQNFRGDIQGLRAISVALVFVYHLVPAWLPHGFIGVDTFFVISGYIITALLIREIHLTGTIAIPRFLARRVKRLLPNATLVLAAIVVMVILFEQAYITEPIMRDLQAAALYFANFHFAAVSVDYFDSQRSASPVIHFWSLSVEEQFYLIFPVIIVAAAALSRRSGQIKRNAVIVISLIIASSFLFMMVTLKTDQPKAFFHSGARFWQLAAGAGLAFVEPNLHRFVDGLRSLLAVVGLLLIGFIAFLPHEIGQFPGLLSAVPVAGATMVIAAGFTSSSLDQGIVSKALATEPMRWFGDRSYSIYLWHWPVFLFASRWIGQSGWALAAAALAAIILAELAYRFVETPFRSLKFKQLGSAPQIFAGLTLSGLVAASVMAIPALQIRLQDEKTAELSQRLKAAHADSGIAYSDGCHMDSPQIAQPECAYGRSDAGRTVVIMGDSHAAQWFPALQKAVRIAGWKMNTWSKSSCPGARISLFDRHRKVPYAECSEWRDRLLKRIVETKGSLAVVLSSSNGYSTSTLAKDGTTILSNRDADKEFERGLIETARIIVGAGHKVIIVRDNPLAEPGYLDCLARNYGQGCGRARERAVNPDLVEMRAVAAVPGAILVDATDEFCDETNCSVVRGEMVLYRDDSHMTAKFNETLYSYIIDALSKTGL